MKGRVRGERNDGEWGEDCGNRVCVQDGGAGSSGETGRLR